MTKIYGLCEKCNKRFAYLCADCVMRETAATRAELAAEYEQLDKANEAAPSWGAAVGARHERMTAIVRTLVGLDLKEREDRAKERQAPLDALTVVQAFQDTEGWSDNTLVMLLTNFINTDAFHGAERLGDALNAYLKTRQGDESLVDEFPDYDDQGNLKPGVDHS